MSDGSRAGLLYVVGNGDGLDHPLGTYTQGIGGILQDIPVNEIFNTTLIIFFGDIHAFEGSHSQRFRPVGNLPDLGRAESARVDGKGMNLEIHYLFEIDRTIGSIQP